MERVKDLYDKCWDLYRKYKEIINYLIFGGLTVVVNFVTYFIFARLIGVDEVVSNVVSWFVAVLFAYVTNKIFVFESKTETKTETLKEMASFFICRLASGVIDVGLFYIMVEKLMVSDVITKIVTQVIVIVANYLFSKLWIFKKEET